MITQEQVEVLRELEQDERKMYHHTADALAAAIATIEGLPVTKDGVHVAPEDEVYSILRPGYSTRAGFTVDTAEWCSTAAAARGEVEGG